MKDKYRKKNITRKDMTFDNTQVTITTTKDIARFLEKHSVWCGKCGDKFIGMIMHAKTSDNKRMKKDCITECKKIFAGKKK